MNTCHSGRSGDRSVEVPHITFVNLKSCSVMRSVDDVLSALEEELPDNVYGIALEPPDPRAETDEDSDAEEGADPNRLNRHQLRAPCHVLRRDTESDNEIEDEAPGSTQRMRESARKKNDFSFTVKDNIVSNGLPIFPAPNYEKYRDFSPHELMELFWTDDFLEEVVLQISQYCVFKNRADINAEVRELRTFLGILLLSGYAYFPQRWMYWSNEPGLGNELVKEGMRKNRFEQIMQFLHFANNFTIDSHDKFFKIRSVINHLQAKFKEYFVPVQNISHDEAIIEYFGRSSMKQHIIQKPIRFGYKVWCLNTPEGYLISFEPYQGKSGQYDEELAKVYGKSSSTVLSLLSRLPQETQELPFHVTFDNFFTSLDLLVGLKSKGWDGTGTIRINRLSKKCPVKSPEALKRQERGSMSCAVAKQSGHTISIVRWKDNNVVTTASTVYGSDPVQNVTRWSQAKKSRIQVPAPKSIREYNRAMGGTDRQDQNVNCYRIGLRGKKWWFPVFTWLVDVSLQNAWLLGRNSGADECDTLLEFRRSVATYWIKHCGTVAKRSGRRAETTPAGDELRYDQQGHLLTRGTSRRRCQGDMCTSRTIYECKKCDCGLCPNCFAGFHYR